MSKLRDSKTYSINDFISWKNNDELELSPKFQRNKVWNNNVKSYLIDTILRGMPIHPIFITQKIDLTTKKTLREVIDGQQRLTAIIGFKNNEFKILASHNKELANKTYDELEESLKISFLEYDLPVEIIKTEADAIIYDIFARLNSNNITLNKQELRNAKYWGEFKVIINNLALEYKDFLKSIKTFSDPQFSRMLDNEFLASLMMLTIDGVLSENAAQIDSFYKKYDAKFEEADRYIQRFKECMNYISSILTSQQFKFFNKKVPFYTLFASILFCKYQVPNIINSDIDFDISKYTFDIKRIKSVLVELESDMDRIEDDVLDREEHIKLLRFVDLHKTRTTNSKERKERISALINRIISY